MSGEPTFPGAERLESPKAATPSSPPATGADELPFQANETIGQTSPQHNYRHSRAYRHFKNPPQPHMCIRVSTLQGEELFINVLSWTRIVIPQEPSDPIPLYGGMRVPPGNPRCPSLVYAVMANPEVLKDSGRHSKDPEERRAMVELMCDFVEAMNPDVKLTRNAIILKDRDISGELKDVWNAVQAQRDREREEEFARKHGLPSPDSIFYKSALRELQERLQKQQHQQQYQQQQPQLQQMQPTHNSNPPTADNKIMYMEFGPESAPIYRKDVQSAQDEVRPTENTATAAGAQSAISITGGEATSQNVDKISSEGKTASETESDDTTDSTKAVGPFDQRAIDLGNSLAQVNNTPANPVNTQQTAVSSPATPTISTPSNAAIVSLASTTTTTTTTATPTSTSTPPAKKEKLGFLPNGCHSIFPRFKNHKHKDKDKEKDKDKDKEKDSNKSSNHSKEKTLLNTFKKSTAAAASVLGKTQQDETKTTQFEKNCVNLSADMEKLDISKLESSDVLIKLKVASSGAK